MYCLHTNEQGIKQNLMFLMIYDRYFALIPFVSLVSNIPKCLVVCWFVLLSCVFEILKKIVLILTLYVLVGGYSTIHIWVFPLLSCNYRRDVCTLNRKSSNFGLLTQRHFVLFHNCVTYLFSITMSCNIGGSRRPITGLDQ